MRRCLGPPQGVSLSTQARHGRPEPSASLLVPLTLSHRKAVFQSQSAPSQASGVRGGPRVPLMSRPTFKEQGPLRSFQEPTRQQEHPSGGGGGRDLQGLQGPGPPAPLVSSPGGAGRGHGGTPRGRPLGLAATENNCFLSPERNSPNREGHGGDPNAWGLPCWGLGAFQEPPRPPG